MISSQINHFSVSKPNDSQSCKNSNLISKFILLYGTIGTPPVNWKWNHLGMSEFFTTNKIIDENMVHHIEPPVKPFLRWHCNYDGDRADPVITWKIVQYSATERLADLGQLCKSFWEYIFNGSFGKIF